MISINSIKGLVATELDAVNDLIRQEIMLQHPLVEKMTGHLLQGGGKQLRPLLLLLSANACEYSGTDHIKLAAMLEFFHSATLLHDDVIDESKLRRGQDTANQIWGNKASVLVGDYLFTLHTQILIAIGSFPILKLMTETANKIGYGEIKQLMNRYEYNISVEEYFQVIEAKTSLLFAVSAAIGGLIQGTQQSHVEMLYSYGLHLGNAFQLIDDALDYCSQSEIIGKNIGDDLADGKMTLPLIHALKYANDKDQELIRTSLQKGCRDNFSQILEIIKTTHSIEYTKSIAMKEASLAKEALSNFPDSLYKKAMLDLVDISLKRNF